MRLARWATIKGLDPGEMDQTVADQYAVDLAERMLTARPRQVFRDLCRDWNAAVARHPLLWPQVRLDAGDLRNLTVMPREQIDAGFRNDLEQMLDRFSNPLDLVEGFSKPYAPRTIDDLRGTLERLYSVAVRHHQPTPTIASLADLVRLDVVRSILGHYLERFGTANTKSAGRYAHFLFVVAKY
jgi:hypothetical protein